MSEQKDELNPTMKLGIMTMPMAITNFSMPDGSCPFLIASLEMVNAVLEQTIQKLMQSIILAGKIQGVEVIELDAITMREMAMQAMQKHKDNPEPMQTDYGVVTKEGKVVLDDDYFKANQQGKRTDN